MPRSPRCPNSSRRTWSISFSTSTGVQLFRGRRAATNASLRFSGGVALDAFGNLYIADSSNNRIRKVDTNGIIATVAGNGASGYSGDGGPAANAGLSDPSAWPWMPRVTCTC